MPPCFFRHFVFFCNPLLSLFIVFSLLLFNLLLLLWSCKQEAVKCYRCCCNNTTVVYLACRCRLLGMKEEVRVLTKKRHKSVKIRAFVEEASNCHTSGASLILCHCWALPATSLPFARWLLAYCVTSSTPIFLIFFSFRSNFLLLGMLMMSCFWPVLCTKYLLAFELLECLSECSTFACFSV